MYTGVGANPIYARYVSSNNGSNIDFHRQAIGTTIHKLGHAFGLAHYNNNIYSIMCQTGAGRIVQRVQKTDNDAINVIY